MVPLGIEHRAVAVDQIAGHSRDLLVGSRVQIDDAHAALQLLVVSNPLAIGRPVIVRDLGELAAIDLHRLLIRNVHVPQPQIFVGPSQSLAVGRPHRSKLKPFVAAGDLLFFILAALFLFSRRFGRGFFVLRLVLRFRLLPQFDVSHAVLRRDVDLVFARLVGDVRDPPAIG